MKCALRECCLFYGSGCFTFPLYFLCYSWVGPPSLLTELRQGESLCMYTALWFSAVLCGSVAKWSNAPDCKSGGSCLRGFESLPAHHPALSSDFAVMFPQKSSSRRDTAKFRSRKDGRETKTVIPAHQKTNHMLTSPLPKIKVSLLCLAKNPAPSPSCALRKPAGWHTRNRCVNATGCTWETEKTSMCRPRMTGLTNIVCA